MQSSLMAAMFRAFDLPLPTVPIEESMTAHMHRAGGHLTSKTIILNANNESVDVNCFQATGAVQVNKLCGFITNADTLTNLTAANYNLWDGTAQIDLTKNNGVLSGLGVGSMFLKNAVALNTWAVGDNSIGFFIEPAAGVFEFAPFIIGQKSGVATYIRLSYTTSDAPIAATISACVEWRPLDSGLLVPA